MTEIHKSEIWTKSQCLHHEDMVNQQIFQCLTAQGYAPTDHFRIWKKSDQTVIVCLVDDIRSCSTDYHTDLPYLYDQKTTVITDNFLTCPSIFPVINTPKSFLGFIILPPINNHGLRIEILDFR